ncbi:hypothetical protein OIDMADRAFT_26404 [Oidiodendron maius Zn]|uniref:Uncharacterized protein n=1 Tax=Oidiodendron maius (strain Zn) TaxID=913774 RepID=A0A0C3CXL3_OIDMZ|nr:hypothetical protein OIDMADRAFT_26404 [Oidiodendron maius Zn]
MAVEGSSGGWMDRLSATFARCQAGLHGRRCEYVYTDTWLMEETEGFLKKILRQRGKSFRSISDLGESPPPRESMASQPGEHLHFRPGSVPWIRVQSQDWKYMQGDDDG